MTASNPRVREAPAAEPAEAVRPTVPLLALYCAVCALLFVGLYFATVDLPAVARLDERAVRVFYLAVYSGLGIGLAEFCRWRFSIGADALLRALMLPCLLLAAIAILPYSLLVLRGGDVSPGDAKLLAAIGILVLFGPAIPAGTWALVRMLLARAPAPRASHPAAGDADGSE